MSSEKNVLPKSHITWLALFSTTATLIRCALPILLVSLGMGAAVASLISSFPIVVTLSEHKIWIFSISAFFILFSSVSLFRPGRSCPSNPQLAHLCEKSYRWNKGMLVFTIVLWLIGFFASFLALPLQIWIDQL